MVTEEELQQSEDDSEVAVVFLPIADRYSKSITSLRDFFDHLGPSAKELDTSRKERAIENVDRHIAGMARDGADGPKKVSAVAHLLRKEMSRIAKAFSSTFEGQDLLLDSSNYKDPPPEVLSFAEDPQVQHVLYIMLSTVFESDDIHHELLNRSIIMSLVGYIEVLIAGLATAFYRTTPDAAVTDDNVLSIRDLRTFTTMEEALEAVISRKVDSMLRDGVDDWQKFFEKNLAIKIDELIPDFASWNEVFQRRHLLVHSDGIVDKRYLSRVHWSRLRANVSVPTLGSHLHVDDDYVSNALQLFEAAGMLLCQATWRKLEDSHAPRLAHLLDHVYGCLEPRRWFVAEHLAEFGIKDRYGSELDHLVCRFNRWLAIKRLGRWSEIEKEVKEFDVSAKHPRFASARAALLEDCDEFFALLPTAQISSEDLRRWPILDEMRLDARFATAIDDEKEMRALRADHDVGKPWEP